MFTEAEINKIAELLNEIEINLEKEKFKHISSNIKIISDKKIVLMIDRIKKLVSLVANAKDDNDIQRDAYHMLRHLCDINVLNCLLDNAEHFKLLQDDFEKADYWLKAALVNSKDIVESMFDKKLNPKDHAYFISYAIYSGDTEWVKTLVKKFNVNISLPKYCFEVYARMLNNEELINFFENFKLPVTESSTPNLPSFLSSKIVTQKDNVGINGDLLKSFTEVILGEIEEFLEASDKANRNLLMDILFDTKKTTEEIMAYASHAEPTIGKRFGIIYCCLHKQRWNDDCMKPYKQPLIDSYVERSKNKNEDIKMQEQKTEYLKNYARSILFLFMKGKVIDKVVLTPEEIARKEDIIKKISSKDIIKILLPTSADKEAFQKENEVVYDLIKEEGGEIKYEKNILENKSFLLCLSQKLDSKLQKEAWKQLLIRKDIWQKIFELIKYTPKKTERSPDAMLKIMQAIFYKEATDCTWLELPKIFPPATKVRHYYYEWRNTNTLTKVIDIFTTALESDATLVMKV